MSTRLDFNLFKNAIARRFDLLSQHDMFRADVEGDELWVTYLLSFPPGSNPIYRKRTEYDCSCCRAFIRAMGNAVAIINGRVHTLWDIEVAEPAYQAVADTMNKLVQDVPIRDIFLWRDRNVGTDKNHEEDEGRVLTWNHFHVQLPKRNTGKDFYCANKDIPTKLGEARDLHNVLARSLKELTPDAMDTVLELIAQNSLYRGQEHKYAVEHFATIKRTFDQLKQKDRDTFVWSKLSSTPASVSKIRNTSIGTLLIDLSAGMELEDAVRKFEKVVAPENYKRPTALVTKGMVDKAKATIDALGLTSALDRRYARLTDISISNIVFANRSSRSVMKDRVFDALPTKRAAPKNLAKVEVVPIDTFITDIVPRVESVEVFVENRHASNLVSLVAPDDPHARNLFKWDNGFSWSYNGDVADSIKEKVKRAGGNVTGDLCCRLAWSNWDDLDFHMKEPGGFEIYFNDKRSPFTNGQLDVDMNAGMGRTREPVENIFYSDRRRMKEGAYVLFVHQFAKRETTNVGFEVEFDYLGELTHYAYEKELRHNQKVVVVNFRYTHAHGIEVLTSLPGSGISRVLWGLPTQEFHPVSVLMLSPNYWNDQRGLGNKHYFFMLDGCVNDGQARGFFNEFLHPDLDKHRKVMELVGNRMKTTESTEQLSGLGFSETKHNELVVRVKGNFTRTLKVQI